MALGDRSLDRLPAIPPVGRLLPGVRDTATVLVRIIAETPTISIRNFEDAIAALDRSGIDTRPLIERYANADNRAVGRPFDGD